MLLPRVSGMSSSLYVLSLIELKFLADPQDTAILFGAIEDDQSVQPAIGKTRKQLEAVAGIMFGSDPERAPKACGNAGNHAAVSFQTPLLRQSRESQLISL